MAIVRCERCGPPLREGRNVYSEIPRKPIGYPVSALLCGSYSCATVGMVWLTEPETAEYEEEGRRFFGTTDGCLGVKLHVQ